MDGNTTEAERWLSIAEKLLSARDLHGTRTFAIRARESAPMLADQILAVTDTLLTAQSNPQDWYGILQLVPLTQSMEVVASQYRKLALLLNPGRNRLSFADQAFRFVSEAWNVLSNPSKKAIYDNELRFLQFGQVNQLGQQQQQQPQLQQQQQHQHQHQHQQPQTQTLFMQPHPPPAPKETQTLFMQTPQKETPTQVTQPLFTRRSPRNTDRDGNAALEGGGQLGLNNKPPEQNRPAEPIWRRQMNQIGLAGTSQVNQSGSVGSSQINQPEPAQSQVNRPEPTQSQVNRPEPIRMSQINQTGADSRSQFNRAEPARTDQINQTTTHLPPRENSQTQPTSVTQPREATESEGLTFWTACPYCYVLYEYPKLYEDCTLRCQTKNCRRAFHAVVIPSPPVNGKDMHFSCWGFFPLGFSRGGNFPCWSPISAMFACPNNQNAGKQNASKKSAPRVYYDDDDDVYVDISDSIDTSDDDDWRNEKRKKTKNAKGKGSVGRNAKKPQSDRLKKATKEETNVDRSGNLSGVSTVPDGAPTAESSRRGVVNSGRKQMGRGAKNLGKLDLNVEFSNEVEEPAPRRSEGNHAGYGEEDNIEGNGFFEGLDEFLNSLPILSAVGDDKVKAT
ncbi:EMF1-Interacting Protein 9, SUVH1/3-interacting DNAJ domain-containing protein 1 [Hibiscus trionum]|uniref:EMF1-Interacting Protein 9, SUVH1/3-interacting DNAJ domain-containing protein 1 n=1 Tax=Hibiscus trionum TaxID=183268 RepID=A0A9W7M3I0_HIBTR|nr:EMF1-Interacting Protein 9, SUVH1/3-interacting DNAJ domain-containing protein 1 [Hibiscus trionum]